MTPETGRWIQIISLLLVVFVCTLWVITGEISALLSIVSLVVFGVGKLVEETKRQE